MEIKTIVELEETLTNLIDNGDIFQIFIDDFTTEKYWAEPVALISDMREGVFSDIEFPVTISFHMQNEVYHTIKNILPVHIDVID